MQMMVKSMRQASLGEGIMDSDQSRFYRDMYDQQLALHLAESGGLGLAEVIKRQLSGNNESADLPPKALIDYRQQAIPVIPTLPGGARTEASDAISSNKPEFSSPEAFVQQLWPLAQEAASRIGQKPEVLIAQAALETGWGKSAPRHGDGSSSHNLFGIKADQRWSGSRVMVPTLEFENGVPVRRQAAFRAYDSFQDSFRDYVDFIQGNPRYQQALAAQDGRSYLQELQQAGYATDPKYAEKINAIVKRLEGTQALAQLKISGAQPL
jgi:flagellar protein FlgJ